MKIDDVDFSAYNDISAYNDSRSRPVVVVIGMYDCTYATYTSFYCFNTIYYLI